MSRPIRVAYAPSLFQCIQLTIIRLAVYYETQFTDISRVSTTFISQTSEPEAAVQTPAQPPSDPTRV